MDGIELVDSFDFNPHKWLQVNFDCSAFWVRDRESLYDALSITPEYLRTKACEAGLISFSRCSTSESLFDESHFWVCCWDHEIFVLISVYVIVSSLSLYDASFFEI